LARKLEYAARALDEASAAIRAVLAEMQGGREGHVRPGRDHGPAPLFEPSRDDRPHTNNPSERWPGMPAAALSIATEALSLVQDADHVLPTLVDMEPWERSATVAILAGRARKVQARLQPFAREIPPSFWTDLRVFFGKLTTFTKRVRCEWIEALSTQWQTDWDLYVRYHTRRLEEGRGMDGQTPPLAPEERARLLRDRLRAVVQSRYPVQDARRLLEEARPYIPEDDPLLAQVQRILGEPRASQESSDAAQPEWEAGDGEEPGDDIGNRAEPDPPPQSRRRARTV
jgi:hypothetical protein